MCKEKIFMKAFNLLITLLFYCFLQTACAQNVHTTDEPIAKIAAQDNVKFGFAVTYDGLKNSTNYQNIVKQNATTIVPENDLKWRWIHPDKNKYNFQKSDYIINYAVLNNMQARGHTLVWHAGIPQYVLNEKDPKNVEKLLRDHITTVVGRYKGKINSWDVINEVIHIKDNQPNGLRNSYWYQVLGEKYIDIAFDAAHKADPNAILVYNEWGVEHGSKSNVAKREAVLALIKRLKDRNVPIDGFGIQAHISTDGVKAIGDDLTKFIENLHNLGLKVYITELDVKDNNSASYTVPEAYNRFLDYALKSNNIDSVLVWGVFNKQNSNNNEIPQYLFDKGTGCNSSCVAVKEAFEND